MQTQDISVNKSIVKFMFSLLVFGFLATGMASATTQAARADARASSLVFNSFQIRTKTVDPDRQEREQVLAEFSARHTLSVLQIMGWKSHPVPQSRNTTQAKVKWLKRT